jgi:ATP-dependent DNA helicase RecG
MLTLNSSISELHRVGKTTATVLKKLGLATARDLLFYLPFRYDDFRDSVKIADLQAGQNANVRGEIELIQNKKSWKRRMFVTEALVTDGSDTLKVIWFNQPFLTRSYKVGDKISLAGRVSANYGALAMLSPVSEKIYSDDLIHTHGLVPNYHLTADLTQKQIRFLIKQVIPLAATETDWLPPEIRRRLGLLGLANALRQIHFPKNKEEASAAERRLGFTELFLRQLQAQLIKRARSRRRARSLAFHEDATKKFVTALPFNLTDDQKKAAWEILKDLAKPAPMSRLLAGDVGSGKTVVVIIALLNAALNKQQAALMAPTEILAHQHFNNISRLLDGWRLKISLLTHNNRDSEAAAADIIIGTHALIQKNQKFPRLALAVVDEQHRFGVQQRQELLNFNSAEGLTPHFLSLSATPIPRSLALAIYGDLDLSIIKQLPAGRRPVVTKIVTEAKRTAAYDFIRTQIKEGRQAFIICPLIDESDRLGVKSVKAEHARLDREIFPELKVGLLHGRLKAAAKEKVMTDFLANKTQVLVATSLIEVGVDIPNATLMLIEGAERFGLAQLHQFRGRVGRGSHQSYCLLFPSREEINNPKTLERLEALTKYNDGFALARIDLQQRGAGELYGAAQSGFPELQIASLFDYAAIKKAQEEAAALIAANPDLDKYPLLRKKLNEWESGGHME